MKILLDDKYYLIIKNNGDNYQIELFQNNKKVFVEGGCFIVKKGNRYFDSRGAEIISTSWLEAIEKYNIKVRKKKLRKLLS